METLALQGPEDSSRLTQDLILIIRDLLSQGGARFG
jgi:hypothetical protein